MSQQTTTQTNYKTPEKNRLEDMISNQLITDEVKSILAYLEYQRNLRYGMLISDLDVDQVKSNIILGELRTYQKLLTLIGKKSVSLS